MDEISKLVEIVEATVTKATYRTSALPPSGINPVHQTTRAELSLENSVSVPDPRISSTYVSQKVDLSEIRYEGPANISVGDRIRVYVNLVRRDEMDNYLIPYERREMHKTETAFQISKLDSNGKTLQEYVSTKDLPPVGNFY